MKKIRYKGRTYKVTGTTKGAKPLAHATVTRRTKKGTYTFKVKNLEIRRALAKKSRR